MSGVSRQYFPLVHMILKASFMFLTRPVKGIISGIRRPMREIISKYFAYFIAASKRLKLSQEWKSRKWRPSTFFTARQEARRNDGSRATFCKSSSGEGSYVVISANFVSVSFASDHCLFQILNSPISRRLFSMELSALGASTSPAWADATQNGDTRICEIWRSVIQ